MREFDFNVLSLGCSLAAPGLVLVFLQNHKLRCLEIVFTLLDNVVVVIFLCIYLCGWAVGRFHSTSCSCLGKNFFARFSRNEFNGHHMVAVPVRAY